MRDLYRILQVERNASKQAIKQAYKNLARKYHPDLLSADERGNPSVLEKIQDLNEAYAVLSDDQKRQEYDAALKIEEERIAEAASPFERRSLVMRCARTKQTYKMLLARRKHTREKFEVTGFEAMDKPRLPISNWLGLISTVLRKPRELMLKSKATEHSFEPKFYTESPIGMEDINWRKETRCPDCELTPTLRTNKNITGWFVCGVCKQLFYADRFDDFYDTVFSENKITWCPWCGKRNKISEDSFGKKWRIRGQEQADSQNKDRHLLSDDKPKALGDGKEK